MRKETRIKLANLISNVLNPFLMSLVAYVLITYQSRLSVATVVRWSLILAFVSLSPILLIVAYLVWNGKLGDLFTIVRQQKAELHLLLAVVAAVDFVVLWGIDAPRFLQAGLVMCLVGLVVFMFIGLWWKISLHVAFATMLAVVIGVLCGWMAGVAAIPLLLVGWARVELKEHSVAQVIAGALIAAVIGVVGFRLFGII